MPASREATAGASGMRIPRLAVLAEGNRGDRLFRLLTAAFAAMILVIIGALAVQMVRGSLMSLRAFHFGFLTGTAWDPVKESFGSLPYAYGTLASSLLALVIAVPVSIGVAVFLVEYAPPWLLRPVGFVVELLAAVPSVVFGLWGIFVLTPALRSHIEPSLGALLGWLPLFEGPSRGFGLLAGGMILAIMILPTISSISREVLLAVPRSVREGAISLGATRWEMIRMVVLPFARSGIAGAVILGLGRAVGETMAVTMVIGNRPAISASLFAPASTMASVIANEYSEATGDLHLSALTEIGLVLLAITLLMNALARLLVWRIARMPGKGRIVGLKQGGRP